MEPETVKPLPEDLELQCFACETHKARYVCRYRMDEMVIQVCLCDRCREIDTHRLVKHTLGISDEGAGLSMDGQTHQAELPPVGCRRSLLY